MTPNSLFNIILKIIGLFFIRDFLVLVPQVLSLISFIFNFSEGISPLVALLLSTAVYAMLSYLLMFRTNWVIEKLRLAEGFEENVLPLNIHRSTVLNIAVMVIGALLVINSVPSLLRQVYLYIQLNREKYSVIDVTPNPDTSLVIVLIVELVIGLLMLGYNRAIVNYIELRRKPRTQVAE